MGVAAQMICLSALFTCCVAPLCFECNQDDTGCADNFALPNTAAIFCEGTCLKRRGEQYSDSVRYIEVSRTCMRQRDDGCFDDHWNGISVKSCACNTDYCNGSNTPHPHWTSLAVSLISVCAVWVLSTGCSFIML